MNITTLQLTPADRAAFHTLPFEELVVTADTFFFLGAETLNDLWLLAPEAKPQTTSVEATAVHAINSAARWAQTSDGNFALMWLLPGEEPLFVMIGENLITVTPDARHYRLAGLPMDLVNCGHRLPPGRQGSQLVIGSWSLDGSEVLVVDVVDLNELTAALS